MALTPSNPFPVGTKAPNFILPDTVSGQTLSLNDVKGINGTVILFICNHCPFVIHINKEIVRLANDYANKGIGFIAISSNDVESYPQDAPDLMKIHAAENKYPFPYLYDQSQQVAKSYDAACTPDFYVFDNNLSSVYHGQLDDSRPGNDVEASGSSIRQSLNALILEHAPITEQKNSVGCGIKWK
ncbi:MAG: peroxiredoxin [Vicingaceae bacterium]|jgi:peroxiredoxin